MGELGESIKRVREMGELLGLNSSNKPQKDKTEMLVGIVEHGLEAIAKAYAAKEMAKANSPPAQQYPQVQYPQQVQYQQPLPQQLTEEELALMQEAAEIERHAQDMINDSVNNPPNKAIIPKSSKDLNMTFR